MKKTIKSFIDNSSINAKLIRAVVRQSGGWASFQETASDITNYGVNGGFSGWTYHTETCEFYAKNQPLIVELAEQIADDIGYQSAQDMVKGFNCLDATLSEIEYTLYGTRRQHDTQVANALAWFVVEEVVRSFIWVVG